MSTETAGVMLANPDVNNPGVQELVDEALEGVEEVGKGVGTVVDGVADVVEDTSEVIGHVKDWSATFSQILDGVDGGPLGFDVVLEPLADTASQYSSEMSNLEATLSSASDDIRELADQIKMATADLSAFPKVDDARFAIVTGGIEIELTFDDGTSTTFEIGSRRQARRRTVATMPHVLSNYVENVSSVAKERRAIDLEAELVNVGEVCKKDVVGLWNLVIKELLAVYYEIKDTMTQTWKDVEAEIQPALDAIEPVVELFGTNTIDIEAPVDVGNAGIMTLARGSSGSDAEKGPLITRDGTTGNIVAKGSATVLGSSLDLSVYVNDTGFGAAAEVDLFNVLSGGLSIEYEYGQNFAISIAVGLALRGSAIKDIVVGIIEAIVFIAELIPIDDIVDALSELQEQIDLLYDQPLGACIAEPADAALEGVEKLLKKVYPEGVATLQELKTWLENLMDDLLDKIGATDDWLTIGGNITLTAGSSEVSAKMQTYVSLFNAFSHSFDIEIGYTASCEKEKDGYSCAEGETLCVADDVDQADPVCDEPRSGYECFGITCNQILSDPLTVDMTCEEPKADFQCPMDDMQCGYNGYLESISMPDVYVPEITGYECTNKRELCVNFDDYEEEQNITVCADESVEVPEFCLDYPETCSGNSNVLDDLESLYMNATGRLRMKVAGKDETWCITTKNAQEVTMADCDSLTTQDWLYNVESGLIKSTETGTCIESSDWTSTSGGDVTLSECDASNKNMVWDFTDAEKIQLREESVKSTSCVATLYSDADHTTEDSRINSASSGATDFDGTAADNVVRSVYVPAGCMIVLFEDSGFAGNFATAFGSDSGAFYSATELWNLGLSTKGSAVISSIKIRPSSCVADVGLQNVGLGEYLKGKSYIYKWISESCCAMWTDDNSPADASSTKIRIHHLSSTAVGIMQQANEWYLTPYELSGDNHRTGKVSKPTAQEVLSETILFNAWETHDLEAAVCIENLHHDGEDVLVIGADASSCAASSTSVEKESCTSSYQVQGVTFNSGCTTQYTKIAENRDCAGTGWLGVMDKNECAETCDDRGFEYFIRATNGVYDGNCKCAYYGCTQTENTQYGLILYMVGTNSHKYDANDYVWMKSDEKGRTAAPGSFSSFTDEYLWKITDQSTSSTAVPFANIDPEMCYGWKGTCLGVDVNGNLKTRPCQERTYQQTWRHFDEYSYDINTCSTALELVKIPSGTVGDCSKSICYKFQGEYEACDATVDPPYVRYSKTVAGTDLVWCRRDIEVYPPLGPDAVWNSTKTMPYNRTCSCPAGYSEGLRNENAPDMGYECIEDLDNSYERACTCDEGYSLSGDTCYEDVANDDDEGGDTVPTYERACENKILDVAETIESIGRSAVAQAMPYLDAAKKAFWKVYRFSEKILSTTKYSCSQKCQEAILTMWDQLRANVDDVTEWLVDGPLDVATALADDLVTVSDAFADATSSISDALGGVEKIANLPVGFPGISVSGFTNTLNELQNTLDGVEQTFVSQSETMEGWKEQIALAADELAFPALTGVNITVDLERGIGVRLYFGERNFGFTLEWGRRRRVAEKLFPVNTGPWDRKRRAATCADAAEDVVQHALSAFAPVYEEIKDGVLNSIEAVEEEFNKKKNWVEYIKTAFTDGIITTRSCGCTDSRALYVAGTCTSATIETHDHLFDNGDDPRAGFFCVHAACVHPMPLMGRPFGVTKTCKKRVFGKTWRWPCRWGFGSCKDGYNPSGPVCTTTPYYTRKVDCNYGDYSGFSDILTTCMKAAVDFTCDTQCSGGKGDNSKWICGTGDNCDLLEEFCILNPNTAFEDEPDR